MLRQIVHATVQRKRVRGRHWRNLETLYFDCGHFRRWEGVAPRYGGKAHCDACDRSRVRHEEN